MNERAGRVIAGAAAGVLVAAMLTSVAGAASGSECPADSRATASARADLVAAARVVAVDQGRATLALQRVFKGDGDWQIEVALPPGDTTFHPGQSYLVFLEKTAAGLSMAPCSGTVPHGEAGAIIDGLGPGHKPGGAAAAPAPAASAPPPTASSPADPGSANADDGSLPTGAASPPPGAGGCAACSIVPGPHEAGWLAFLALASLGAARRRRR